MQQRPVFIIAGVIGGFAVMCSLAFWLGQQQQKGVSSKAAMAPVKRLRAKEGTERKNARALTSSIPSPETARSSDDVDVWGSLDRPSSSGGMTDEEKKLQDTLAADTPEEAIRVLLQYLAYQDGEASASAQAVLAYQYMQLDPPDSERADAMFASAWEAADAPQARVEVTYFLAKSALEQGRYDDVFQSLSRIASEDLPASGYSLELSILAGMAYEGFGEVDAAVGAYEHAMEQARNVGLDTHEQVKNVYRTAGLRLGNLHRSHGETTQAIAVGRKVQLALNP